MGGSGVESLTRIQRWRVLDLAPCWAAVRAYPFLAEAKNEEARLGAAMAV